MRRQGAIYMSKFGYLAGLFLACELVKSPVAWKKYKNNAAWNGDLLAL